MLKSFLHLGKSPGLRSATFTTIGNIFSTGLGAIAFIIIGRFLPPSDFGVFSTVFSLMLLVSKLGDLGSNVALQRELSQPHLIFGTTKRRIIETSGFYLKIALALLVLLIGIILGSPLTTWLNLEAQEYIILGFFSMIGIIVYDYFSVLAQSYSRFGLSVLGSAIQSAIKIVVILALIFYRALSPQALIILYGFAPLCASVMIAYLLGFIPLKLEFSKVTHSLAKLTPTIRWTALATLSAALADNVDILLVQSLLTSQETGLYSAAARIAGFVAVASYSFGVVLNVRVAKYKTQEHLIKYLQKATLISSLAILLLIILASFSHHLIFYSTGASYLAATSTLKLLLYSTGLLMATTPFVALFFTLNAPAYFGLSGVLMAVSLIAGDYFLIPLLGIEGAGFAKLISRGLVFIFTLVFAYFSYQKEYGKKS